MSEFNKCPNCQMKAYNSTVDYCEACGYEEIPNVVCGGCLNEQEDGTWIFCPYCGDKYDDAS